MNENSSKRSIDPNMMQYQASLNFEAQKADKLKEFKDRVAPFAMVSTFEEAKELAKKILPTANEINRFYVGDAKCMIVNRNDLLRISIDSATEFICYDFEK